MRSVIKPETLEDLLKEHIKFAKEYYEKHKEFDAMVIGYTGSNRIVLPLLFEDDIQKEFLLQMFTKIFTAYNVTRYTIANECYALSSGTADPDKEHEKLRREGKRISDHPDHIEALMCIAVSYKDSMCTMYKIDPKTKDLSMFNEMGVMKGRFTELLPDINTADQEREIVKKQLETMKVNIELEELLH